MIVKWIELVGLRLVYWDRRSIVLESIEMGRVVVKVRILDIFFFMSEGKRMGIVVRFVERLNEIGDGDGEIWFY